MPLLSTSAACLQITHGERFMLTLWCLGPVMSAVTVLIEASIGALGFACAKSPLSLSTPEVGRC